MELRACKMIVWIPILHELRINKEWKRRHNFPVLEFPVTQIKATKILKISLRRDYSKKQLKKNKKQKTKKNKFNLKNLTKMFLKILKYI